MKAWSGTKRHLPHKFWLAPKFISTINTNCFNTAMPTSQKVARPVIQCMRYNKGPCYFTKSYRFFTSSARSQNEAAAAVETTAWTPTYDPATVVSRKGEKELWKHGVKPIGSRRRRAALRSSQNIPFEQLPYQCFQEARKILLQDREEKLKLIETERMRISNLQNQEYKYHHGPEAEKERQLRERRLSSMRDHLEWLKIQADINDPLIKKRFEDGEGMYHSSESTGNMLIILAGDMNKPIYRYLADRKWRSYQRLITMQRPTQLNVVPDVLPNFDPTAEVRMAFRNHNVQPGQFIDSTVSEVPPRLRVQVFDKGERLISIIVVDSDVPVLETDSFTTRCHFMAVNIPISPTETSLPFSKVTQEQLILPWMPPYSQKGSPYHRLSVIILQHEPGKVIKRKELTEGVRKIKREDFSMRSFLGRYKTKPIGMSLFRSVWDEGTAGVMERAGIPGADIEFKRKRVEAIKPKQRQRGWEATHTGPKYRSIGRGGD